MWSVLTLLTSCLFVCCNRFGLFQGWVAAFGGSSGHEATDWGGIGLSKQQHQAGDGWVAA